MQEFFSYSPSALKKMPLRPQHSNKGTFGRVLVVGGSPLHIDNQSTRPLFTNYILTKKPLNVKIPFGDFGLPKSPNGLIVYLITYSPAVSINIILPF